MQTKADQMNRRMDCVATHLMIVDRNDCHLSSIFGSFFRFIPFVCAPYCGNCVRVSALQRAWCGAFMSGQQSAERCIDIIWSTTARDCNWLCIRHSGESKSKQNYVFTVRYGMSWTSMCYRHRRRSGASKWTVHFDFEVNSIGENKIQNFPWDVTCFHFSCCHTNTHTRHTLLLVLGGSWPVRLHSICTDIGHIGRLT